MINKFPVTKNGIDYEVEINAFDTIEHTWEVFLYIYKTYKIFKIFNHTKKLKLRSKYFGIEKYSDYIDVEYLERVDFIKMANMIITEYEKIRDNKNLFANQLKKATDQFNSWDGKF